MHSDSLSAPTSDAPEAIAAGIPVEGGHGYAGAGAALEPRLYFDPEAAALEQSAIFERTWQLAGHVSDLPEKGSYVTASAGSQSLIVIRGKDDELRAFRNVCRHRGRRLIGDAAGCSRAIRCAYHGWTYALDGTLLGAPELRGFPGGLDRPRLGLHGAGVEVLCGLVFVNLDPEATPLAELRRRPAAAARALRHPLAGAGRRRPRHLPGRQLEGGRRQLPRGLPRADRPPRADAAARLRALRPRHRRELRLVRGADAGRALGEPHRAPLPAAGAADGEAHRRRPRRLALRLHLPEHGDRPLPRPGRLLADQPRRTRAHPRRLRAVASPRGGRFATASSAGSTTASTTSSTTRTSSWSRPCRAA